MRMTGDKFMTSTNAFTTFLTDKEDLPRLSILQNYDQIMRIMNSTYMRGVELEKKYSQTPGGGGVMFEIMNQDQEYMKYKEDEQNTKKMSSILMHINTPIKKRS